MGGSNWDKVMTGCSAGGSVVGVSYQCPYSYDYFATSSYPWIKRGGSFRGGSFSGIFDFGITNAIKRGDKTFRVILSEF